MTPALIIAIALIGWVGGFAFAIGLRWILDRRRVRKSRQDALDNIEWVNRLSLELPARNALRTPLERARQLRAFNNVMRKGPSEAA